MTEPASPAATRSRISTVWVLAAASLLVSGGVLVFLSNGKAVTPPHPDGSRAHIETRTPEAACESFLDAWRKRDYEGALSLSSGDARERVLDRKNRDEGVDPATKKAFAPMWDALARDRLRFHSSQTDNLDGNKLRVAGQARGTFVGKPYVRNVVFIVEKSSPDSYVVHEMQLGEILEGADTDLRSLRGIEESDDERAKSSDPPRPEQRQTEPNNLKVEIPPSKATQLTPIEEPRLQEEKAVP